MALKLTKAHTDLLASIKSGATTHVGKTKEAEALAADGYIEVNPAMLDTSGNAAVRLTEKGNTAVPGTTSTEETPEVSFVIVANVDLPTIKRGGGGSRESKYPLKDIPEGGAIFVPAPADKKPAALSKQFGSMVADFNKRNEDRYLTTRTLADGAEYGFGDQYKGVAGIGIYRRPVSERKEKTSAAE